MADRRWRRAVQIADDELSPTMKAQERDQLLRSLENRFEKNMHRHKGVAWEGVLSRIEASPSALLSLGQMEASGGEPDVIAHDKVSGQVTLCDCSPESPSGRRSLCYDREALNSRKEHAPAGSAVEMAVAMGIELLKEEQYRKLQRLDEFDTKTSSWIVTPPDVRSLGGALFCDRRYDKVFLYHNGAQSYYAARGFRGLLRVLAKVVGVAPPRASMRAARPHLSGAAGRRLLVWKPAVWPAIPLERHARNRVARRLLRLEL